MEETNLNVGFKLFGGAPHTVVETSRETLSVVPEKTDEEVYAQPVEEGHKQGPTFVQGKFMLKKSILKNEDKLQKTLDRKLNELR